MTIINTLKKSQYSKTFFMILIMIDSLCIYCAYHLSFWYSFGYNSVLRGNYLSLEAIWALLWIVIALLINNYETENLKHVDKLIKSTVKALAIHACLLFLYLSFASYYYSSLFIVATYVLTGVFSITLKTTLLYSYRYLRNLSSNTVRYVVVGYTPPGRNIFRHLKKNQKFGYRFMGFFDDTYQGSLVRGKINDIYDYCIRHDIRQIYFALSDKSESLHNLAQFADEHFIHFGLVQEIEGINFQRLTSHTYDNIPVISCELNKKPPASPDFYRKAVRLLKQ